MTWCIVTNLLYIPHITPKQQPNSRNRSRHLGRITVNKFKNIEMYI